MKKIVAIIIAISLIVSCFGAMTASAIVPPEDAVTSFNIDDYTWEDIMTMSNSEFRELLINFEREYDPLGTYETQPLTSIYEVDVETGTVAPQWTSGNIDSNGNYTDNGSHELITARACGILLDDKGFWGANENGSILIALTISLASIIPDTDWSLGILDGFEGHFYDPDSGKSWLGSTTNTAKTNANDNYENACDEYKVNGISEEFIECVGKMLHYIQDVCVPHHASNITALNPTGCHTSFENYVDERINTYIDSFTTISKEAYSAGASMTVGQLVHRAAQLAKEDVDYVSTIGYTVRWDEVAYRTTRRAVSYSAVILYKLSLELDISLTK